MRIPDMTGKRIVATGANSGIGFETAAALAGAGADVTITARSQAKGQAAVAAIQKRGAKGKVALSVFDMASLGAVRAAASDLSRRLERIDVLVNNAGLMLSDRRVTVDGYEMTFQVNHLAPFLLTNLLLERIKSSAPARIVNVASAAHQSARSGLDFDDLQTIRGYSGMGVYGRTKLANILFTGELSRQLAGSGVTANSLHPGTVRSGFAGDGDASGLMALGVAIARPFMLSPAKGAETSIYLAASPEVEGVTGKYFAKCQPRTPSPAARDDDAARRLWAESERLVGLVSA